MYNFLQLRFLDFRSFPFLRHENVVNVKVTQFLYRPITGPEGCRRMKLSYFEIVGA